MRWSSNTTSGGYFPPTAKRLVAVGANSGGRRQLPSRQPQGAISQADLCRHGSRLPVATSAGDGLAVPGRRGMSSSRTERALHTPVRGGRRAARRPQPGDLGHPGELRRPLFWGCRRSCSSVLAGAAEVASPRARRSRGGATGRWPRGVWHRGIRCRRPPLPMDRHHEQRLHRACIGHGHPRRRCGFDRCGGLFRRAAGPSPSRRGERGDRCRRGSCAFGSSESSSRDPACGCHPRGRVSHRGCRGMAQGNDVDVSGGGCGAADQGVRREPAI